MFVTFVSAAFPLFAAIVPTESDTSALSISSPPGSRRKKTKATIGPNISDRPASSVHRNCAHAWTSRV